MGINATIQSIQDGYAHLLELDIVMVDLTGNLHTEISSFPKSVDGVKASSLQQVLHNLPNLKNIKTTLYIDFIPGVKIMVSPVVIDRQIGYYLISGGIVEEESENMVKSYLKEHKEWQQFFPQLDMFPTLSLEEKEKKLILFNQLSEAVSGLLRTEVSVDLYRQNLKGAAVAGQKFSNRNMSLDVFIEQFKRINPFVDFLGVALQKDANTYVIKYYHGLEATRLIDKEILIGEGFLGQTIVTEESAFWSNIQGDPRALIFNQNGLSPMSLFCRPISVENQMKGLLFGGSIKENIKEKLICDSVHLLSAFMGIFINQKSFEEHLNNHLLQLSTFNEIFNVMTTMKDIKRVLYILVDMGLNILRGSFACVIYKETKNQHKLSIISRGLKADSVNQYCRDLGKRYFSGKDSNTITKAAFHQLSDRELVYELPILYQNQLFGVLSIGVQNEEEVTPFIPFLTSLAVAGGISIYLLQKEKGPSSNKRISQVLLKLLEKNHPSKYEQSQAAKEMITSFGHEAQLSAKEIEALQNACYLVHYDKEIIETAIHDSLTLELMNDYLLVTTRNEVLQMIEHPLVKILLVVFNHVGKKLDPNVKRLFVDDPIYQQFEQWVNRFYTYESEIAIQEETQQIGIGNQTIKEELNLSNREIEVLNHVMKGYNNREIAKLLFISDHTVKNHITNILHKLDVSDRPQVIAKVYQMGYIPK